MLNRLIASLRDLLRSRHDLVLENLALRQQILVMQRTNPRPLRLVQPETVIRWHRRSWRMWWRWKSRPGEAGRPRIPWGVIELIRRISRENPTWGAPRIHGEMIKLGYDLDESTVARTIVPRGGPASSCRSGVGRGWGRPEYRSGLPRPAPE